MNLLQRLILFQGIPTLRNSLKVAHRAGLKTLLDYRRLAYLVAAVKFSASLSGNVIEFGSFRGGSAAVMLQHLSKDKVLHVLDSFEGMPEVHEFDNFHQKGDFSETSVQRVDAGLRTIGINFRIHKGFFQDTLPTIDPTGDEKFALAHIDVDLYESVNAALEFCYPRMAKGGVLIFDDYGAPSCEGAKRAVDSFFESRDERLVLLASPSYGCLVGGGDLNDALRQQWGALLRVKAIHHYVFEGDTQQTC
jgi:O-methyltransferase